MDGLTLVTGGAGFIGSHVVDALLASGSDVRVLDDFSTGKEENLDDAWALAAQGGAGLQVMEGDVRDEVRMRDAMDGCTAVVHLAAIVSVPRSVEDPEGCDSVTHGGTVNALRQAVEAGAERFVLASSCAVYGDAAELPIAEVTAPRPLSPYAGAKLASERPAPTPPTPGRSSPPACASSTCTARGRIPARPTPGVISRFLSAAGSGDPVTIYGDGEQTRDFVYVADVVDAVLAALRRPLSGASVVNVGTGRQTDLLQILGVVESLAGAAARAVPGARPRGRGARLARRRRPRSLGARLGGADRLDRGPRRDVGVVRRRRGRVRRRTSARRRPCLARAAIMVGAVPVGGGAPVAVQSMTCTRTGDAEATLGQVRALAAAGCEIVRVSLPTAEEAPAFARVVREADVPIIADIHYDWRLALAAIAAGAAGVRINPGTMAEKHVREIVHAAAEARVPAAPGRVGAPVAIRIGVNAGSLPRDLRAARRRRRARRARRGGAALGRRSSRSGASPPTS